MLKEKTHLPVIVDPSHGTGHARYVAPMAYAAIAAGADGLMIEVHPKPEAGPFRRTPVSSSGRVQGMMEGLKSVWRMPWAERSEGLAFFVQST